MQKVIQLRGKRKRGGSMSKEATISVRIDEQTKKEALELFDKLGISMTTAINLFLQDAIANQRVKFDVKKG